MYRTPSRRVERYTYDAYGQPAVYNASWTVITEAASKDNAIRFCGYVYDAGVGLYHVRHRTYNAPLGRWLQRDFEEYLEGLNLYCYSSAIPTDRRDPMGLKSEKGKGTTAFVWLESRESAWGWAKKTTVRAILSFSTREKEWWVAEMKLDNCLNSEDTEMNASYTYVKGESVTVNEGNGFSETVTVGSDISSEIDKGGYKLGGKVSSGVSRTVSKTTSVSLTNTATRTVGSGVKENVRCGKCKIVDIYQKADVTVIAMSYRWKYRKYGWAVVNESTGWSNNTRLVIVNYDWKAQFRTVVTDGRCGKNGCERTKNPLKAAPLGLKGFPG